MRYRENKSFAYGLAEHYTLRHPYTNTKNPHCHIVYNSTNLDCDGKYQDFRRSAIALRKLSDRICLEHGLSIIENPGLSKGYNRTEYLGGGKTPSVRDQLRDLMDAALPVCKDFDGFLAALKALGVEIKHGKQLAFKLPDGKKFRADITLHKAAKKHFDGLGLKKLPPMQSLKQEYATSLAEKKKLYSGYRTAKENMMELTMAKHNADRLLKVTPDAQNRDDSHGKSRRYSREI